MFFFFKLDDESVFRHENDRKVKSAEEEALIEADNLNAEFDEVIQLDEDEENDEQPNEEPESKVELSEEPSFPDTDFQLKIIPDTKFIKCFNLETINFSIM